MKIQVFLLLILVSINSFSQTIERNDKDEFTGQKIIKTRAYEKGKMTMWKKSDFVDLSEKLFLSMSYVATPDSTKTDTTEVYLLNIILIYAGDLGCLSNYDGKAIILFDDGSTMTIKQTSDIDCSETMYFASYLLIDPEKTDSPIWQQEMYNNINQLEQKIIKKIRIYGTKYYYDCELKPDKKNIVSLHLKLIKENI